PLPGAKFKVPGTYGTSSYDIVPRPVVLDLLSGRAEVCDLEVIGLRVCRTPVNTDTPSYGMGHGAKDDYGDVYEVTDNRQRRTLHEFAAYLGDRAAWAKLSRYGHSTNKGTISAAHRKKAAALLANEMRCQVPRTWKQATEGSVASQDVWIFVKDSNSRLPNGNSLRDCLHCDREYSESAKRFIEARYYSFEDARQLHNTFCLVSYPRRNRAEAYCTCDNWGKSLMCEHVTAIARTYKEDNSPEAVEQWSIFRAYFRGAKKNRGKSGRFDDGILPPNVRYGLGPSVAPADSRNDSRKRGHSKARRSSRNSASAPSKRRKTGHV
ncbi:hypothetical protein FOL47_001265, partial [Perkinsus chesapeaki]